MVEANTQRDLDNIRGIFYEDGDSEEGQSISLNNRIALISPQGLTLMQTQGKRGKVLKQIDIYLVPNEDEVFDEIPQNSTPQVLA